MGDKEEKRGMRVMVFTPTCYNGGIDVTYDALLRQDREGIDIVWLVADDLFLERESEVRDATTGAPFDVVHIDTSLSRQQPELVRTLAHAYDYALAMCRGEGVELMVSLQDYIVPPDDGLRKFARLSENEPDCLLTGACSIASYPPPEMVVDPNGGWTVFEGPWSGPAPTDIDWEDCRFEGVPRDAPPADVNPMWWEANWAAIPRRVIEDVNVMFDLRYDRGVAYENQDYAFSAFANGYRTLMDPSNHAVSLPHKKYRPDLEERDVKHLNAAMHHEKWGLGPAP